MKDVYLRAAQKVDRSKSGFASCVAIAAQVRNYGSVEAQNYAELFAPRELMGCYLLWGKYWCEDDYKARNNCRVLALLFMHWISQEQK
jgi:hypothetical protein